MFFSSETKKIKFGDSEIRYADIHMTLVVVQISYFCLADKYMYSMCNATFRTSLVGDSWINNIPTLIQIMAWRRPGDTLSS